ALATAHLVGDLGDRELAEAATAVAREQDPGPKQNDDSQRDGDLAYSPGAARDRHPSHDDGFKTQRQQAAARPPRRAVRRKWRGAPRRSGRSLPVFVSRRETARRTAS